MCTRPGRLAVSYYDWRLPVSARSYGRVFGTSLLVCLEESHLAEALRARVESLVGNLGRLAVGTTEQFREAADALWELYRDQPAVQRCVDLAMGAFAGRPGDARSFDPLDRLLGEQMYRLAYWRVASPEINYRRFFDVSDLVAMRVEDERVFVATHARVLELVADGHVTGLRIDHIDGLADPLVYLQRLRAALDAPSLLDSASVDAQSEPAGWTSRTAHWLPPERAGESLSGSGEDPDRRRDAARRVAGGGHNGLRVRAGVGGAVD